MTFPSLAAFPFVGPIGGLDDSARRRQDSRPDKDGAAPGSGATAS